MIFCEIAGEAVSLCCSFEKLFLIGGHVLKIPLLWCTDMQNIFVLLFLFDLDFFNIHLKHIFSGGM